MEKSQGKGQNSEPKERTIDEYMAIAMALFNVSFKEAQEMTLYEYGVRKLAYEIRTQKEIEKASLQAWLNNQVKATKKIGGGKNTRYKSIYKNFKDFYDSETEFLKILDGDTEKEEQLTIADLNIALNS